MRLRHNQRNASQAQPAFPLHLHYVTVLKVNLAHELLQKKDSQTKANTVVSMAVPLHFRNTDKSAAYYDSYTDTDTSSADSTGTAETISMSQDDFSELTANPDNELIEQTDADPTNRAKC
jgi:hypothetical protein